jgi:hypothetical protein
MMASNLQQTGVIHCSRGHIQILDLDALKKATCECYGVVRTHYDRLLRPHCRETSGSANAPSPRGKPRPRSV